MFGVRLALRVLMGITILLFLLTITFVYFGYFYRNEYLSRHMFFLNFKMRFIRSSISGQIIRSDNALEFM